MTGGKGKVPRERKRGLRKRLGDDGVFFPVEAMKKAERNREFPLLEAPIDKFGRVRVVMVETKYSGNIGQAARVLKNFGMTKLSLVRPRCEIDADTEKMAVNSEDMLERIQIFDSVEEAVRGARMVIGTTRRRGVQRRNVLDTRAMADLVMPVLSVGDAALLFGAEDRGLTNEDLEHCHWLVTIPTTSDKASFNVSHAIAVALYEITYSLLLPMPRNNAKHENIEAMFDHLKQFLGEIGFLQEADPARMMLLVRQMFYRANLSEREVRTLRGIIHQAFWRINNPGKKPEEPK